MSVTLANETLARREPARTSRPAHRTSKYSTNATIDAMRQSAFGRSMEYAGSADEIREAFGFAPADASEPYYAGLVRVVLEIATELARVRGRPVSVLDVGAGVGRIASEVARHELVAEVVAIEQSLELLREIEIIASGIPREVVVPVSATRHLRAILRPPASPRLLALEGDAHALPFAPSSFSCVLAFGLLDRVERPRAVIAELARVLEPGGAAVVSCLHDFSGGPADADEWLGSAAEAFAKPAWSHVTAWSQRLDLRQNARYIESFDAEVVVARREGDGHTPASSRRDVSAP